MARVSQLIPALDSYPDGSAPAFMLGLWSQVGVRTWLEIQMNLDSILLLDFLRNHCA